MTSEPRREPLFSESNPQAFTADDSPFAMPPLDPQERDSDIDFDPTDSPFSMPAIAGLPFGRNSEEARAIRSVIERAERERATARDS